MSVPGEAGAIALTNYCSQLVVDAEGPRLNRRLVQSRAGNPVRAKFPSAIKAVQELQSM